MTAGSFVSDDELRTLLVDQMELVDAAEFEKAQQMATRLKIPLERALAERGRFPLPFLLAQLAAAWEVGFIELKVGDVQLDALQTVREEYARSHGVVPFEGHDRTLKVAGPATSAPPPRLLAAPAGSEGSGARWFPDRSAPHGTPSGRRPDSPGRPA